VKYWITILSFFIVLLSSAQTAMIKGIVRNTMGESVPGVTIIQKDNIANGAITDKTGYFQMQIPAELKIVLTFKAIGSKTFEQIFELKSGEVKEIEITFDADQVSGGLEIIDRRNQENQIISITTKLPTKLPTINQGIEAYLIQAPVNFPSELSSSFNVRGGSFDENLIYVNDIQVYRPFLVRAGQQEGLSFPNPDMVSKVDFSAGGFQAKYGDKMSSVLDIQYARPDTFSGNAQLGLLGGQLQMMDISKNKKWTYNSGFRYRDYSYILNSMDVQGDYKPRFMDWQNYITWRPMGNYGPLEFSWLTNISSNHYQFTPSTRQTDAGNINEAIRLTVYFEGQEKTQFNTYFSAFSTRYSLSESSQVRFTLSAFDTKESEHFDILGAYRLDELDRDMGSDQFAEILKNRGVGAFLNHGRNDLSANVYQATLKGFKEWEKENHVLNWGMDASSENIHDVLSEWTYIDSAGYAANRPNDSLNYQNPAAQNIQTIHFQDRVKAKNHVVSQRYSAYVQDSWRYKWADGDVFSVTAGVRANHWSFSQQTVAGPRINLAYTPTWLGVRKTIEGQKDSVRKDIVLTAAWGYYYQPPFYREMRGFNGQVNPEIKAQTSIHYIVGANYVFRAWNRPFKFVGELYYKQFKNLIPYEIENVRQRYYATNNAVGYAYGADAMVNGEFIEGVQSWVRASYLKTEEDLKDDYYYIYLNQAGDTIQQGFTLDNVAVDSIRKEPGYLPRPTDQRLSFSLLFMDEMPRNPKYKATINMYFATGVPYGPPLHERYLDVLRTRSYFRTDVGFSRDLFTEKRKDGKNRFFKSGTVSIEVFNLLGVNNIINHQWIEDVNGRMYGIPTYLTGRRINLRWAMSF
jgi:hypothetical protein